MLPIGKQLLLRIRPALLDRSVVQAGAAWRACASTSKRQRQQDEDDDEDERFPSETGTSTSGEPVNAPGFFFISGYAAASAFLALGVAGVGMAGMFWLGNFLTQVLKALKTYPDGQPPPGGARQPAKSFTSVELAQLLQQRRDELEQELRELRGRRPPAPDAKARAAAVDGELRLLREAAAGRQRSLWGWGPSPS